MPEGYPHVRQISFQRVGNSAHCRLNIPLEIAEKFKIEQGTYVTVKIKPTKDGHMKLEVEEVKLSVK